VKQSALCGAAVAAAAAARLSLNNTCTICSARLRVKQIVNVPFKLNLAAATA
jgi:hypothetical protein